MNKFQYVGIISSLLAIAFAIMKVAEILEKMVP